jgi:hypothetical protein
MSKDRKRRLRKLTGAMLGALGMAGSVANINTNADVQQETTSLLAKTGIGAGIISGLGILGLTAYNTLKDKKDPTDEEYKKLILENAKLAKDEEDKRREKIKKREELQQKYGLSAIEMTNVTTVINTHLRGAGKPNLSEDEILSAISGMQNEEQILARARAGDFAGTSFWINREIANELTIDKLNKSLAALQELPEGVNGTSMLTTVQLIGGGVRSGIKALPQISNAQTNYAAPVLGQSIFGSLQPMTKNQIAAADALMPENVKTLVGGCWGVSPVCPTLGKSIAVVGSTAYTGLFVASGLCHHGGNNYAGYRNFTLVGWKGDGGTDVYQSGRMTGTLLDGRDGRLGMDLILGPDCNSNNAGVTTKSWGMGLGLGDTKNILKKLNKTELKNLNASIFKTVYEFTHQ